MNNTISIVVTVQDLTDVCWFESLKFTKEIKDTPFESDDITYVNKVDGLEVDLIVGYDKTTDKKAVEYFTKIADKILEVEDLNLIANTYNQLFTLCNKDYVCVINRLTFVSVGWLNELYAYNKLIDKVGSISIVSNLLNCDYISLLSSDGENMVGVYLPKQEYFDTFSILFFSTQHLYWVGALDNNLTIKNYVFEQWQMRCARMGLNNFAIPNASCIHIPKNITVKTNAELKLTIDTVEEMRKNKNFYIPLLPIP